MTAQKWKLIAGNVYQLLAVFDSDSEAVVHAQEVREDRTAVIIKTQDERWAVYWRPRSKSEANLATHCGFIV